MAPGQAPDDATTDDADNRDEFLSRLEDSFKRGAKAPGDGPGDTPDESTDETTDDGGEVTEAGSIGEGEGGEGSEVPGEVEGIRQPAPDVEEGGEPTPPTPPTEPTPSPAPSPAPSPDPESYTIGDRTLTADQAREALHVYDWAQGLTPDHVAVIDAVFSGDYVVVPRDQAPPPSQPGTSPVPPSGASGGGGGDEIDLDALDPDTRAYIERQRAQIEQYVQQATQPLIQANAQQHQQQVIAQLDQGAQTFMQRMNLTEQDIGTLQQRVAETGILPGIASRHRNNLSAAMEEALEAAYWTTPQYRDRAIAAQTEAQLAADRQRATEDAKRQRKASSLTGSAGSVPRTQPPATKQDRDKAMVGDIAAAMSGGQADT